MVDYRAEDLLPFPLERVWKMLQDHLDDARIVTIHPLIKSQHTVARTGESLEVDRVIDARGKRLASRWRYTVRPPDLFRWDIVTSDGPYAPGGWLENRYVAEGGGTRVRSSGNLKVTVVPFFFPQRSVLNRVFDTIDREDRAYLHG